MRVAALATAVAIAAYLLSGIASRLIKFLSPTPPAKAANALRFGILGAAKVNKFGILLPSLAMADVRIVAIGARDTRRAKQVADQWGIPKYGDYQSVLADPDVEAVYIPLLNGLHYEWASAALHAGKHVLLEKPMTANAAEARALADLASARGLILFEAYHWAYHPLAARMREVIRSGELGDLTQVEVSAGIPSLSAVLQAIGLQSRRRDVSSKMDVSLGGGKFLGQGCYAVSAARYLLGEPVRVLNATMDEDIPGSQADVGTRASVLFTGNVVAHLVHAPLGTGFNVVAHGSKATMSVCNYWTPFIYHHLRVTRADGSLERVERVFGEGDSNFVLQLRAFFNAVRKGEKFPTTAHDAVGNMELIDSIYEMAGLRKRPSHAPL
ncbi:hypothetical protein AB1Y20_012162 [Prymnesium parvum]|uniref:D-xylose 1-dehydrogenase (NADP(+), D-xylono-1,5-lactone-forming) n=1 Tax=Prymnesium parvum TaxID=97485 RepID=A0AB34IPS9_PRYPA